MLPTTPKNEALHPKPTELYDPNTGRVWPRHLLDRFIVGHIYASNDFTESSIHLGLADGSFLVTSEELQQFWYTVLMNSNIHSFWHQKGSEDVEVKRVLQDIHKTLMDDAQKFLDEHYHEFKDIGAS